MTSKTSLFNRSIFLNNLRRLWWGSLLYFIILVLVMPMQISMSGVTYYAEFQQASNPPSVFDSLLFRNSFSLFAIGLLIVVPVLVSLLLFRYLHVKKQAAAIHSLPVTRLSLFVTNFVSGIVLMYLPILLNGIILMCYCTFGGYCSVMPMTSIFAFVGLQLLFSAVLFAVPVFFAMLTGNTILQVIFTYASYYLPIGLCTGVSYLMSLVLFGYRDNITFLDPLFEQIPIFQLIRAFNGDHTFGAIDVIFLLILTVLLLVFAYLFYRRRNLETAGDAISFQWLKPVFKYLVTICLCVLVVTYSSALNNQISVLTGILFLTAAVVAYFGSEMLMRKSFRVFHCWRGFLVFIAIVAVISAGVKADVFGYEKRIPDIANVSSASYGTEDMNIRDAPKFPVAPASASYGTEDFATNTERVEGEVDNPETIQLIADVHRSIIAHKQELLEAPYPDSAGNRRYYRTISYRMKDGEIFTRHYRIDEAVIEDALKPLYESQDYKKAYFDVVRRFQDTDFTSAEIHSSYSYSMDSDTAKEVYRLILADIDTLGYEDINPADKDVLCTVSFTKMDDKKQTVARSADIHITPNFKNTIAYLREHNIYQRVVISPANVEKIMVSVLNETVGEMTDKEAIRKLLEDYRKGNFLKSVPGEENYEIIAVMENGEQFSLGVMDTAPYFMKTPAE